jgi:hypothetical protein
MSSKSQAAIDALFEEGILVLPLRDLLHWIWLSISLSHISLGSFCITNPHLSWSWDGIGGAQILTWACPYRTKFSNMMQM